LAGTPNDALPGLARSHATSSLKSFAPVEGLAAIANSNEQRDRHEIFPAVEGGLGLHHRLQVHRRARGDENRRAVGRRTLDRLDADHAVGAGAVLDDHRAIQREPKLLGNEAAEGISAAAGGKRKDDPCERAGLRKGWGGRRQRQAGKRCQEVPAMHGFLPNSDV
jgi:hypothetical protein